MAHLPRLMLFTLLLLPCPALAAGEKTPTPVWGYMGGGNDDEGWGTLSQDFATCDTGTNQSPVEIGTTKRSAMPPLDMHYRTSQAHIEKKDRTLVIDVDGRNSVEDEGHSYKLVQMRIHTPAEHQVLDKMYPMELHLIHRSDKGKILIISLFAELGDKGNPVVQSIVENAPAKTAITVNITFNPKELLPVKQGYYAYSGSLSWPPCTEGVEWRVFKNPITISKEQMKTIGELLGRNARLLQPLYLRTVRETIN